MSPTIGNPRVNILLVLKNTRPFSPLLLRSFCLTVHVSGIPYSLEGQTLKVAPISPTTPLREVTGGPSAWSHNHLKGVCLCVWATVCPHTTMIRHRTTTVSLFVVYRPRDIRRRSRPYLLIILSHECFQ